VSSVVSYVFPFSIRFLTALYFFEDPD